MKLPRDLRGSELVKGLRRVGYELTRQKGDHAYLTTLQNAERHVTVPFTTPCVLEPWRASWTPFPLT
jgi:predicted RNA binding protein YcfA (HicA-like mRNA interferase family)